MEKKLSNDNGGCRYFSLYQLVVEEGKYSEGRTQDFLKEKGLTILFAYIFLNPLVCFNIYIMTLLGIL